LKKEPTTSAASVKKFLPSPSESPPNLSNTFLISFLNLSSLKILFLNSSSIFF